jgi:murein DD-endopeptidase MepM/ murein hydrolase activator NlpD
MPDHTAVHRLVLALVAVALVLVPARPAPAAPADDPLAEAQQRVEEAQQRASDAAGRYQAVLAELTRLTDEIARLEREIPALRAKAEALREQVRRRAAALYTGFDPGTTFEAPSRGDGIDPARHAHLTEAATRYDLDLADQLRSTAERLQAAEDELRVKKAEQELVAVQLDEERKRVDLRLAQAQVVLDRLRALASAGATVGRDGGLVRTGAEICPVQGALAFTNDWGQPRSEGRTHQGTDVFAVLGTPAVAIVSGTVTDASGGLGGISVDLRGDDGVRYYYAHLASIALTGRVEAGEVIGAVGNTGNAAGGAPHVHFQLHPGGGEPVNPYPTLKVLCG